MAEGRIGDRVSSENELALKYGVSRMTARKALNELFHDGQVEKRFVSPSRQLFGRSAGCGSAWKP